MDVILKVNIKRTKCSLKSITGSHYFYDWYSFAQFRIQGKNEKMYVLIHLFILSTILYLEVSACHWRYSGEQESNGQLPQSLQLIRRGRH